ncbi:MAG: sugar phosphate isomerase/epimerase family protein [Limnochordia bacterium]
MLYLSYLPDEMNVSFEEALKIGSELGLKWVEMRAVDGVNGIDLSDSQVEQAKRLLDRYNMKVSAVATPFLKCTMPGLDHEASGPMHAAREMSYEEHLELISRGAELAKVFGTDKIRFFSFWYKEDVDFWDTLNEALTEALKRLEGTGVTIGVENEGACMIRHTGDLAEAAGRLDPQVKFIYDPGNAARIGHPPRQEDFDVFVDRIALVHVKDGVWDPEKGESHATLVGEGAVNWQEELKRIASGYKGALTLEPHYAPDGDTVRGMKESVAAIRRIAEENGIVLG